MKQLLILVAAIGMLQAAHAKEAVKTVTMQVTENGFEPNEIKVKAGTPVILKITRKTDSTCATQIQVKEKKIKKNLPLNKEVSVDLGTLAKGDIRFACGMDMISGHVVID